MIYTYGPYLEFMMNLYTGLWHLHWLFTGHLDQSLHEYWLPAFLFAYVQPMFIQLVLCSFVLVANLLLYVLFCVCLWCCLNCCVDYHVLVECYSCCYYFRVDQSVVFELLLLLYIIYLIGIMIVSLVAIWVSINICEIIFDVVHTLS